MALPGQVNPPPTPVVIGGEEHWHRRKFWMRDLGGHRLGYLLNEQRNWQPAVVVSKLKAGVGTQIKNRDPGIDDSQSSRDRGGIPSLT